MKIVFVTTQSVHQSTVIGRVLPLAKELAKKHEVTITVHAEQAESVQYYSETVASGVHIREAGVNPFVRTAIGKKHISTARLIYTLLKNAVLAGSAILEEKADVVVLVKPLPENTFAVLLAKLLLWRLKVVVDVDDFELMANTITSVFERFAIHASERLSLFLASHIVVATPFLQDHMEGLAAGKKPITLIPTGITLELPVHGSSIQSMPTILYVGSISLSSGHRVDMLPEILFELKKQYPSVKLLIAGSGDDEVEIKKQCSEKGVEEHVEWFGRFSPRDIPSLVKNATIMIDPIDGGIVNRAKSSYRTAVALAAGMPIVTSNIGIRTQLLPAQLHDRLFATAGNTHSYVQKIQELFSQPLSPDQQELMRTVAKKYRWDALAQMYYDTLV